MADPVTGLIIGGISRLAPEIMGAIDRRNERKHEREMFKVQIEADRLRAEQKIEQTQVEGGISLDMAGLGALTAAIQGQAEMAKAAGGFAASASALVRPAVTYVLLALYVLYKICMIAIAFMQEDRSLVTIAAAVYTVDDITIFSGVLSFWFLDRVISKR